MKDVILIDLQENNLHSLNEYIKTINAVVNVPSMQQYIQRNILYLLLLIGPVRFTLGQLSLVLSYIMINQTSLILFYHFFLL